MANIRINDLVKEELDSIKYYETDSYSDLIKRIIEENKQLQEDKKNLYKILLNNEDSVDLTNNVSKATYFIANVISEENTSEAEKLEVLETYLAEIITSDSASIIGSIEILKDSSSGKSLDILTKFENYVRTN